MQVITENTKTTKETLTEGKTLSAGAKFVEGGTKAVGGGAVCNKPLFSRFARGINCKGKTGGIVSPASAR